MLAFGQYRPDVSDYQGEHSQTIANVLPRADGYGPMPDFTAFTSAMAAVCRGFFTGRNTDSSPAIFSGTSTKLYKLDNTDFAFDDASKALSTYTALSANHHWQFEQFNTRVLAVQANTVPQTFTLGSSTEFADLAGSPPQASYITTVNRFVVLSGLLSEPFRVHWSGLNAPATWTSGTTQSDFQDFPRGGVVRGVAGGEYGLVFQDTMIRRMTYAPGSPLIFQFDELTDDMGLLAPYSLVNVGNKVFFLSAHGFQKIESGGIPVPIGKERVDRTFFADVDTGNLGLVIGAADPASSKVFWTYKSTAGQTGLFDKMLCYDWALDKWAPVTMVGEYLSTLARPGLTLEGLDTISGSIDALTFSLDDVSTASMTQLSMVNSANKLGFFTGDNLAATLVTSERGNNGRRMFVRGFRPISDAATVYGSVGARETVQASSSYSTETLVNAIGVCPQRVSTRYARGKVRIPAATDWSYATGIEPDIVQEGLR